MDTSYPEIFNATPNALLVFISKLEPLLASSAPMTVTNVIVKGTVWLVTVLLILEF